jgi:hypothetical protein
MNELPNEAVQLAPALAAAVVGATLVVGGLRWGPREWIQHPGAERAHIYLYTFRKVVVGLALLAAAIAWAEQIPWLLTVSVTVGIGEWLESSYYLMVMRTVGRETTARPARALRPGP